MKKGLIIFLAIWGWAAAGWGQVNPCEGFDVIPFSRPSHVIDTLAEYANPDYRSPLGNEIWLCFQLEEGKPVPEVNTPLTLHNTSGLPVVISGLNIRGGPELGENTLLSVSGGSPVIIRDSSFSNCKNCLAVRRGNGFRVENSAVTCNNNEGVGIRLYGWAHQVLGTEVSQCGAGIRIGQIGGAAGNNMEVREGRIHHNHIGIHLAFGTGNRFVQNSIYENDSNGDGIFAGDEGILLAPGANGGISFEIIPAAGAEAEVVPGALHYSPETIENFNCESLPETWPATLRLSSSFSEGYVVIDFTHSAAEETHGIPHAQGKEFMGEAVCNPDADGIILCDVEMRQEFVDRQIVSSFQHPGFGTSHYSSPFVLNSPCPGVLSAPSMDAPELVASGDSGTLGDVADLGDTNVPPSDDTDDDDDDGSSMSADPLGGAASSGAGVVAGGLAGSGAPGGVGGCGANLAALTPLEAQEAFLLLVEFLAGSLCFLLILSVLILIRTTFFDKRKKTRR